MHKIFILTTCLISQLSFAQQNTWALKHATLEDDYFTRSVEDNNENIYAISTSYHASLTNGKLIKISSHGNVLIQTQTLINDSCLYVSNLFVLPNQNIVIIG